MGEVSRIPRVGAAVLLGLAIGLLWCAVSVLVHHTSALAAEDASEDGLLGAVAPAVPVENEVTEAVESAVRATDTVIADTVAELPPLGHLPSPQDAADTVSEPVVDHVVEPVTDPVVEHVVAPLAEAIVDGDLLAIDLLDPVWDAVDTAVGDPAHSSVVSQPAAQVLVTTATLPDPAPSDQDAPQPTITTEPAPAAGDALVAPPGTATASGSTAGVAAAEDTAATAPVDPRSTRAVPHNRAAPPGPTVPTDAIPG